MKKLAAAAFSTIHRFLQPGASMVDFNLDDVLTVLPTEFSFPSSFELNKENSCSIQLTNKTDRIVAYQVWCSWWLVSTDEDRYVSTILPWSTSSVTVTLNRLTTEPLDGMEGIIQIYAYAVNDGVKAEDITRENLYRLTTGLRGVFELPVVYYTAPADNSCSAVPENNEKESLLDDHNNVKESLLDDDNNDVLSSVHWFRPWVLLRTLGGYGSSSRRKSKDTRAKPSFKAFSPKEIEDATNNFSESLMIGEGGYGKVYKCQLGNWDVAVKILDNQGDQGIKEYIKEMEVLEGMKHENLIHLMGTCFKFRALVYEHLPNGSLEDCLKYRPEKLTWEIRTHIVYEICTVLRFLHANEPEPLVHGDVKPANVLLDAKFKVKLADFGLCRYLTQGKNSKAFRLTTHASGSDGYMDPDYMATLKVNAAIDVYSFGKTVVKILTGKYPPDIFSEVYKAKRTGSFMDIVDPAVRHWPENVVEILTRFALKASKPDRYRSEFMGNFYSELEKILDGIDNSTTTAI